MLTRQPTAPTVIHITLPPLTIKSNIEHCNKDIKNATQDPLITTYPKYDILTTHERHHVPDLKILLQTLNQYFCNNDKKEKIHTQIQKVSKLK